MDRQQRLQRTLAREFQLPREQLPGEGCVKLISCDQLEAQGCVGVLDCSEDLISLNMRNYILEITGFCLTIVDYTDSRVNVRGELVRLELRRG